VKECPGNRVVTVVKVFPTTLQPYLVDRFVRLCEFGWDAWVVCNRFDEQEWAKIPSLASSPKLRERVRVSDSDGPGSQVAELSPQLVHVAFGYLAPRLMYLRQRPGCKIVVSFESYESQLVADPECYRPVWTEADAVHTVSEHLGGSSSVPAARLTSFTPLSPPALMRTSSTPGRGFTPTLPVERDRFVC
jgi:hypothetical protein